LILLRAKTIFFYSLVYVYLYLLFVSCLSLFLFFSFPIFFVLLLLSPLILSSILTCVFSFWRAFFLYDYYIFIYVLCFFFWRWCNILCWYDRIFSIVGIVCSWWLVRYGVLMCFSIFWQVSWDNKIDIRIKVWYLLRKLKCHSQQTWNIGNYLDVGFMPFKMSFIIFCTFSLTLFDYKWKDILLYTTLELYFFHN